MKEDDHVEVVVAVRTTPAPNPSVFWQKRGAEGAFAKHWEFPGGKVERGETHKSALTRELREELHLEIETFNSKPFLIASFSPPLMRNCTLYAYYITSLGKAVRLENQMMVGWTSIKDLKHFELQTPFTRLISEYLMIVNHGK